MPRPSFLRVRHLPVLRTVAATWTHVHITAVIRRVGQASIWAGPSASCHAVPSFAIAATFSVWSTCR
jgi:hypothetical protein